MRVELSKEEIRDHLKRYPLPAWCKKKKSHVSREFSRSKEWTELKRMVIDRYGAICMCCGSAHRIQVDHIRPKSKYPELSLDFDNMQILCWTCNRKKNFRHETDYRPPACA